MKLSSMRYQTLSTFTDFKRNEEKTDNEVNYKDILSLFDNLNHVQASDVHWFSFLGKTQGKKEETGKGEEEGKGKGKDADDHESKHRGKIEVKNEVKEDDKDDGKNESKV